MSGGRLVLRVSRSEGRNLLLQRSKVGLVLKQECLIIAVGMGKAGHSSSCTGVVDAGMSKCCFFVVKGMHGVGEECTEVGPGVLDFRHCIPSANLQGELGEQLHVVDAFQNSRVHVESILGIAEFLNAAVLAANILVDGATRVVGSVKEIGDFANVGSTERSETFFKRLKYFASKGLMGVVFIRVDVCNKSVRDRVDDVENTGKIGV